MEIPSGPSSAELLETFAQTLEDVFEKVDETAAADARGGRDAYAEDGAWLAREEVADLAMKAEVLVAQGLMRSVPPGVSAEQYQQAMMRHNMMLQQRQQQQMMQQQAQQQQQKATPAKKKGAAKPPPAPTKAPSSQTRLPGPLTRWLAAPRPPTNTSWTESRRPG